MEKTLITQSEKDTSLFAEDFLHQLDTNLIFLKGELGSGKTAFVRGLGKSLGINRIQSPTYTIIRSYKLSNPVSIEGYRFNAFHHVDLYRIANLEEIQTLGLEEIIADNDNLVAVEWPELIEAKFDFPHRTIGFEVLEGNNRKITIQ